MAEREVDKFSFFIQLPVYVGKNWDSDTHEEIENGFEGRQAASILGHTFPHISEIILKVE